MKGHRPILSWTITLCLIRLGAGGGGTRHWQIYMPIGRIKQRLWGGLGEHAARDRPGRVGVVWPGEVSRGIFVAGAQ